MTASSFIVPLGEIVEIVMGQAPPSKDCNFEIRGTPFVKVGEFGETRPILREWTTNPLRMAHRTDVLLCVVGATCGKINLGEDCAIGRSVAAIRPQKDKLDQYFLYYFMLTLVERLRLASVGAAQTVISKDMIQSVKIPLLSLGEQRRIVAILDEVFAGIATAAANAKKNLANAREIFDSEVQSILAKRGEGWTDQTLDQVCLVERGSSPRPIKEFFTTATNGINWIKIGDTEEGGKYVYSTAQKITPEGAKQSRFVKEGDFILTNSMSFGRPYIMKTSGCIHDGWFVLRLNAAIDVDYFYYLLSSNFVQSQFVKLASGSVVKNISGDLVKMAVLPVPPLAHQHIIVKKLIRLSDEIHRLESVYQQKLAALGELKKTLLHKAFNGGLSARHADANVVPFPQTILNITTTDLHAGILAIAYQQHENTKYKGTFHHVKAEKIAHMVESYVGVNLGRNPIKDAAGPNDYPHLRKVEHRANMAGFFSFTQQKGEGYLFQKKNKFSGLINKTVDALGEHYDEVNTLIKLMLPMDMSQAEIFATVYAAWNNLILENKPISDEAIVYEARENWHEAKLKIPRERFFKAIEWIRNNNILPKGVGKLVSKASA